MSKQELLYSDVPDYADSSGFFTGRFGNNYGRRLPTSVRELFQLNALTWASIGSGKGRFEWWLKYKQGVDVTCVDPDPKAYGSGDVIVEPEFPTVKELISARSDVVGKMATLLLWPSPNSGDGFGTAEADSDDEEESKVAYDLDAIQRLRPPVVVIMYAACGASGSEDLLYWLSSHDGYTVLLRDECPVYRGGFIGTVAYELLVLGRNDWDRFDEVKEIFA